MNQLSQQQPKLRITVTDGSTVFTGAANLHRFDAPSEHEIVAYAKNVLGPFPEGAPVHITASAERLARLEAAFADYDVALRMEELVGVGVGVDKQEPHEPREPFVMEDDWEQNWLVDEPEEPLAERSQWPLYLLGAALAAVVVLVGVGAVWAVRAWNAPSASAQAESPTTTVVTTSEASAPEPAPPQTTVLEQDGLRVELPAGFTLAEDGDTWRATGLDPDFRLHMAVEQLYNLPAHTMAEQVLRDIEVDPETQLVDTDGHSLTYLEFPGDGSEVLWKTWPHDNYQIFVACHTRTAPTTVQQATCRMAFDSAEFSPPTTG
ncbi:type VII secretion-associated protein [Corynebacterium sp. HMSC29G08]|uniref:type VII secretion-associated protein n=1 Tax=Corynebacterium sp. HMSC29G08 TaxID=1581069 RepID=UPI0008A4C9F5|nr:type VII secretion-associated protein [Corynebacterium sp. HMSC29G08]OFT82497.1 hypothetical protein HMPREF3101_07445 [Corynebacterium sp. HMSC29G08]